jgi:hypothetical protein
MHNRQSRMIPFVIGIILGILCTIYLPEYVRPYLPESMMGKETVVKGTVMTKEHKRGALLLTVNTPEGSLLATCKDKADEVNLLVNEKDEIQFILPKYMPFINDPKIIRVVKEKKAVPELAEAPAEPARPAVKNSKEMKPRQKVKPQAAQVTPPGNAMEEKPPGQAASTLQ